MKRPIALLAVLVVATACAGPIGQAAAVKLATDFFEKAHGPGDVISDVRVESVQQATDGGRPVWEVQIDGNVTEPGSTHVTYVSAMWLHVFVDTGAVTIWAEG